MKVSKELNIFKGRKKVKEKEFDNEAELQNFIYNNPEIVLQSIGFKSQKVAFKAKEIQTPNGKSVDVLFILDSGIVLLIEIKLACNTDSRRVFQQIDEYWSNILSSPNIFIDTLRKRGLTDNSLILKINEKIRNRAVWRIIVMDNISWDIETVAVQRILENELICMLEVHHIVEESITILNNIVLHNPSGKPKNIISEDLLLKQYSARGASKFIETFLNTFNELYSKYPDRINIVSRQKYFSWEIKSPLLSHTCKVDLYFLPANMNQGGIWTYSEKDDFVIRKLAQKYGLISKIRKPKRRKQELIYGLVLPFPKQVDELNGLVEKYMQLIKDLVEG